jgi:alpha-L-fucosidase
MQRLISVLVVVLAGLVQAQAPASKLRVWEEFKYGLFVHYVWGGELSKMTPLPGGKSVYPVDINDLTTRFDAGKWASDVKSMGYEYVIFTAWHANMNPLYPSAVMTKWRGEMNSSKRDLLGGIIDSLAARGIKTSLYTCIVNGHDFHPGGVTAFKEGDTSDALVTDDQRKTGFWPAARKGATAQDKVKWNDFLNEMYGEMFSRYGDKVFLLWGDCAWTSSVDYPRLFATIRKSAPNIIFLRNSAAGGGFDVGCKELSAPRDGYGMMDLNPEVKAEDEKTWPTYSNSISFIQGGYWWASPWGKAKYSGEKIYRYTILTAAVSTGGGVNWSIGTYADGSWEPGVLESMRRANSLLESVSESWKKTLPSKSFVTKQGARIETLPQGFVATRSQNDSLEYIHVLKAPAGRTLTLPATADGKRFTKAELLPGNIPATLRVLASGYELELPAGKNWDTLNTVFKLIRAPDVTENIALDRPITASSTCLGNAAGNVVSSSALSGSQWSSCLSGEGGYTGGSVPQWLTVDLGENHKHWSLLSWKVTSVNDGDGAVAAMVLQASKDGSVWASLDSVSDNKSRVMQRPLASIEAPRYLRIRITKASTNWDPRIKIAGLELPAIRTARLYPNTDFSGASIGLPVGRYSRQELSARGFGDNSLSSLAVPQGWRVELFDEDGFSKPLGSFQADVSSLVSSGWNDRATSIVVAAGGTVGITQNVTQRLRVVNGVVSVPGISGGVLLERDLSGRILARHPIQDGKAKLAEGAKGLRVLEVHGERGVTTQPVRVVIP